MEGRQKLHVNKYKEIVSDSNYVTHCMRMSLLGVHLKFSEYLMLVAQSVQLNACIHSFIFSSVCA